MQMVDEKLLTVARLVKNPLIWQQLFDAPRIKDSDEYSVALSDLEDAMAAVEEDLLSFNYSLG